MALTDRQCVAFLQWALPRLGLRWRGFRRVRKQVCKRLRRRLSALGLADLGAYRAFLETHPAEWGELDPLCRITISRFYRDRGIFNDLSNRVMPELGRSAEAAGRRAVRAWSIGCASGEEAYSLVLAWRLGGGTGESELPLEVLGTDIDPSLLERARRACYPWGSLRELPEPWRRRAFRSVGQEACLRPRFREGTRFLRQDVRKARPEGAFDLILCRNLVLTYYRTPLQREVLGPILDRLRPGGALVVGAHEELPPGTAGLRPWPAARAAFRKSGA